MSGQGNASKKADLLAIDRVREAHVDAMNRGDPDAFAGVFTEDAAQMPPNETANVGREKIRAWAQGFFNSVRAEFALEVEEVRVAGEWAFERGSYRIRVSPRAGGGSFPDTGKYITIYESQPGGGWLTARDIWNSDHPAPGTREQG
jgi:uncharacterized protein (TIGR02246 family)